MFFSACSSKKKDERPMEQSPIKKRIPIRTEPSQDQCIQIVKNRNKYKQNAINEHISLDKLLQKKSQINYEQPDLALKKFRKKYKNLKKTF